QLTREAAPHRVAVVLQLADTPTGVPSGTGPLPTTPAAEPIKPKVREHTRLNSSFSFDSFVTGKANQLARAAALQVSEHPGTAYNQLFIYGGGGLGKTNLIQDISNLVHHQN